MENIHEEYVYVYTRQNALDDGVLVDISELAREAGFKIPVAITETLHNLLEYYPEDSGQDYTGRLWDVLNLCKFQSKKADGSWLKFQCPILTPQHTSKPKVYNLVAQCRPGDKFEPVITIGLEEDF